jgi:hypothetical protein
VKDRIKVKGKVMENWEEIVRRSEVYSEIPLE